MNSGESVLGPSRLAVWLIVLFGPGQQGQAVLGDLLEEYSLLRKKQGVPAANRWFWAQTLRTIAYLIGSEFRSAPLTITAAAIGGFFLRWYVSRSLNPTITTAVDALLHRYHVYELDPHAYIFWSIHIMYAERFLVNLFIGFVLGMALKEREMAGTIALAVLGDLLAIQSMLTATARTANTGYLWTLPWSFAFSVAVVAGGAIVRTRRSQAGSVTGKPT
jgi:hypothetical protein